MKGKIITYDWNKCDKSDKDMFHGICFKKQALGDKCTVDGKTCLAKPKGKHLTPIRS